MIESISIENFRCFQHTRIEGFKRVNLIGGQNNAGKTTLLEAILLGVNPSEKSITFVQHKLRDVGNKSAPEQTWQNFFYNLDTRLEATISLSTSEATFGGKFAVKDGKKESGRDSENIKIANETPVKVEDKSDGESEAVQSSLIVNIFRAGQYLSSEMRLDAKKGKTKFGIAGGFSAPFYYTVLIMAGIKPYPNVMAEDFETLRFQGQDHILLDAVKVMDPSIERAEVFSVGTKKIYLQRQGQPFMPITMFGDAVNKVANMALRIANNQNGILLMDEIENSIHYTHQREFWRLLLKLTGQFNVQVFSTSHSLEMIRAFNEVGGIDAFRGEMQYIEMYRSVRSGQIAGNTIAHDTLAYSLANNQTFRGE